MSFMNAWRRRKTLKIQAAFNALEDSRQLLLSRMSNLEVTARTRLKDHTRKNSFSEAHLVADAKARRELQLFLSDFLALSFADVTELHEKTSSEWRKWILEPLSSSIEELVPLAARDQYHKIQMMKLQGYPLTNNLRAFYIQADIADSIDGVGHTYFRHEETSVYRVAEQLLLAEILENSISLYGMKNASEFKFVTWYYTTLFSEFMQWSHREGPFKVHTAQM